MDPSLCLIRRVLDVVGMTKYSLNMHGLTAATNHFIYLNISVYVRPGR